MVNLAPKVTDILDNSTLEVLVYSGDKDFICNWRGGEAWTTGCKWTGKEDFDKAEYADWNVGNAAAGALRQHGKLQFLRVFEAGHMVPMNQPEAALQMIKEFTSGGLNTTAPAEPEDEPRELLQW
jgi:cathepsin A (carboxypeptidase C)